MEKSKLKRILRKTAVVLIIAGAVGMVFCYYMLFYATRPPQPFVQPDFHTRKGSPTFSVAMFSDCGMRLNVVREIGKDLRKDGDPAFVMFLGDMGQAVTLEEWSCVEKVFRNSFGTIPVYGTPGNHDARTERELNAFRLMFGNGQMYWTVGDTLFITLNTAFVKLEPRQLEWLEFVLKQHRAEFRRCVLMTHVPPVNPNPMKRRRSLTPDEAEALRKLTDKYHVNMIVCGHVHIFTDTDHPRPECKDVKFGKTRLVILPTSGQGSRDPEDGRFGYVRFDFRADGTIGVEPKMLSKDSTKSGLDHFLRAHLNRRTAGFSFSLGVALGGLLLLVSARLTDSKKDEN